MKRENLSDCFNLIALAALFLAATLSGCAAVRDEPYRGDHEYHALPVGSPKPDRPSDKPVQKPKPAPKPTRPRTR